MRANVVTVVDLILATPYFILLWAKMTGFNGAGYGPNDLWLEGYCLKRANDLAWTLEVFSSTRSFLLALVVVVIVVAAAVAAIIIIVMRSVRQIICDRA